jgi:antitoxin (DNA-binding transcriptional repressor) of toxin-antitoxin stability system
MHEVTMPTLVTLEDAQARLPQLLEQLHPGEEIIITRDGRPVARLIRQGTPPRTPRRPGTSKGTVLYMAPDFDAPLEDFKGCVE